MEYLFNRVEDRFLWMVTEVVNASSEVARKHFLPLVWKVYAILSEKINSIPINIGVSNNPPSIT